MSEDEIRFDDAAGYDRMMGSWSRLVGEVFLDWLKPEPGLRWIDVGCGTGVFTELLIQRCEPVEILGVDPSNSQLDFARRQNKAGVARFEQGHALALPCPDRSVDAAVMALVIFFVPDPAQGLTEMRRVVKPGGLVCAYAWDVFGLEGFPLRPLQDAMLDVGAKLQLPPKAEVGQMDALVALWTEAGLTDITSREIVVVRSFKNFEEFWSISQAAGSLREMLSKMNKTDIELFKDRLRTSLPLDGAGRITYRSRANAIAGFVPHYEG